MTTPVTVHTVACHVYHFKISGWQVTYRSCKQESHQTILATVKWLTGIMQGITP